MIAKYIHEILDTFDLLISILNLDNLFEDLVEA